MSTFWWTGASSGDFGTAGNFIKDDATTNTLPADNDTLIFDGRGNSNNEIISVTGGYDALKAIKLASLIVLPSYTGNIGDAANFIEISALEMFLQGSGICSILFGEWTGAAYTATTCNLCIIDTDAGTINLKVAANTSTISCKFTRMIINAGLVFLKENGSGNGVDVTTLQVNGGAVQIGEDCFHNIASPTFMDIIQTAGTILSDSPAGNITISGGEFTHGTNAATPTTCPNITLLILCGGTFTWNAVFTGAVPKITDAIITGGTMTVTGKVKKQVGNSANIWPVLRGATLDLDNPSGVVDFGTNCYAKTFGGTLVLPANTAVRWDN